MSSYFHIKLEWLQGAAEAMYPDLDFYKNPGEFHRYMFENLRPYAHVYCFKDFADLDTIAHSNDRNIVIVFGEDIDGLPAEQEAERYRIVTTQWAWDYPKCRLQLKANLRNLYNSELKPHFCGRDASKTECDALAWGSIWPRDLIHRSPRHNAWHLDDYILGQGETLIGRHQHEFARVEAYARGIAEGKYEMAEFS